MRWLVLPALVLSLVLTVGTRPGVAATGFDSSYFGESAFLSLAPGSSGQFAAGFNNTGAIGWQTGTPTQVNLAICLADKTTCNVPSPNAAWAVSWYSSTSYAPQSTAFVGPGQTGWFVYTVRPPAGATGTTRFNGEVVLAATGERIHPEGYYQEATVAGTVLTPTRIDSSPPYQTARIGDFPAVGAVVTANAPTSGVARPPVPNVAVVFEITGNTTFNSPLTFTATTNASGLAAIAYTRNNPGTDSIVSYLADTPSIRAGATLVWGLTAGSITVTPKDAVLAANDVSGCRTYGFTARNPANGAPLANALLHVNFLENIARTTDNDGGATIVADATASPTPTTSVNKTADANGQGTFQVCGNGSTARVTPILFDNASNGDPQVLETNDNADTGGAITFQARVPTLTLTPAAALGRVLGDQAVYTITAVDQFGTAYTGAVRVSFTETQTAGGSTSGYITWYDNDANLATVGVTGGSAPTGTTDIPDTQNVLIPALNGSGKATFGVYAGASTRATPIVWVDANSDTRVQSTETQATGGSATWAAATLTSCTLTKSKQLAAASAGSANTNVLSDGDVFVVFTFRDQSGTPMSPPTPTTITFNVMNTAGATIAVRAEGQSSDTLLTAGQAGSVTTAFTVGGPTTYAVVDSAGAASASVSVNASTGGASVACAVAVRWVNVPAATSGSLTGTVIDVEKGSSTTDGGGYVLQTISGNYVVNYSNGQPMIVTGTSVDEAGFEAALSLGDTILWSFNSGAQSHNITTNN